MSDPASKTTERSRPPPSIYLMRLLPAEVAHALSIWAIRADLWRVAVVIDALSTLAWAIPAAWLLRWCEREAADGN